MATKKNKYNKPGTTVEMTQGEAESKSVVLQHIVVQSVDTTTKDIKDWVDAGDTAISVYYPNRSDLYDLFRRIMLDGHLSGVWRKHIASIRNKELCYYDPEGKEVKEMNALYENEYYREFVRLIMESESHGISGMEFIPGAQFMFIEINRKHIQPHKRVILKYQWDNDGMPYDKRWNILVVGNKDNLGFLYKCAPYVLWKQGNYGDWAQFCEVYGQPTEVYEYDVFDIKTKQAAADLMKNTGGSRRLLVPKQLKFEMKDGKQSSGDGNLYDKLRHACNDEISVCILGNTETTMSSDSSGYGQSKEHANQQDEIMNDDLQLVCNVHNSAKFIAILKSYGYPVVDGGYFKYKKNANVAVLNQKVSIDVAVSKQVPVGDQYWYDTYDIPKPDNYDELKAKMEAEREARMSHMLSSGVNDNGDVDTPPLGDGGKGKDDSDGTDNNIRKNSKEKAKANLTRWQEFRSWLSDFFDHGHKD
jgi:hypothetical protein